MEEDAKRISEDAIFLGCSPFLYVVILSNPWFAFKEKEENVSGVPLR